MTRGTRSAALTALALAPLACTADEPAREGPAADVRPPVIAAEPGTLFRGTFSPDGLAFYYFLKVSQNGEDYRIFCTNRTGAEWSEPTLVPLGDPDASSMYPALSPDGELLVFSTYRPEGTENFATFAPDDSTLVFVRDFSRFHSVVLGG